MAKKKRLAILFISLFLLLAVSFAYSASKQSPHASITISLPSATLPSQWKLVTLGDLTTNLQDYANTFVEVQGLNMGGLARPACSPWVGPPTEWVIYAEPVNYTPTVVQKNGGTEYSFYQPPHIEIQNTFDGIVTVNTRIKRAAVWGWVRLYNGPVGCIAHDQSGTTILPEVQHVWYIEAVRLQPLESIDIATPR